MSSKARQIHQEGACDDCRRKNCHCKHVIKPVSSTATRFHQEVACDNCHQKNRHCQHGENNNSIIIHKEYVLNKVEECILYTCVVKAGKHEGRQQLEPNEVTAVVRGMVEAKRPGFTNTKKWQDPFLKQTVQSWRRGPRGGVDWSVIDKRFKEGPDWYLAQVSRLLPGETKLGFYVPGRHEIEDEQDHASPAPKTPSPPPKMPSPPRPLRVQNTSEVDTRPTPLDDPFDDPFDDTFDGPLPEVDMDATPFDEPVSRAVSALSLGAPSIPRGLQDSARGSTIPEFADSLSIHKAQSSIPSYELRRRDIGGAGLPGPSQEYSHTDPITGAKQSLGPGPTYDINRQTSTYSRPPPVYESPYSQEATGRDKSKARGGETAKNKEKSSESSSSPSRGSDPRPRKRRGGVTEGGGGHKHAETGHKKSEKGHKDAGGSKEKEKKDETVDEVKPKNKKRPRQTR